MKLTIGTTAYNNFDEVWFTIQALRLYQDLADAEILVVDNYGDENLRRYIDIWGQQSVRYVKHTVSIGPAGAKNRIFAEARGEWVLAIDSHVLLIPDAIARFKAWSNDNPDCQDLLQGPLLYDDLRQTADCMNDEWRGGMWGTWHHAHVNKDGPSYEIKMQGMGLFGCRKDSWLGFNPAFYGFGGEEGYIHEKYRKAGHKVICLPFLQWNHFFRPGAAPFPVSQRDRITNYTIGMNELGLDKTPMLNHFNLQKEE